MVIKVTKKIKDKFKTMQIVNSTAENRYCEWFADLVEVAEKEYFVVANVYSMMFFAFPVKDASSLAKFQEKCISEINQLCEYFKFNALYKEYIAPNANSIRFTKNDDRSCTAKINAVKSYLQQIPAKNPVEHAKILCTLHKFPLENGTAEKPCKVFSSDFMKLPIEQKNTYSIKNTKQENVKIVKVYKLYVALKDFKPAIWRRCLIQADSKLLTVASMLLSVFNADGSHLYRFDIPTLKNYKNYLKSENSPDIDIETACNDKSIQKRFRKIEAEVYIDDYANKRDELYYAEQNIIIPKKEDVRVLKLKDVFTTVGDEMTFVYDFGDDWNFSVRLEEQYEDENHSAKLPCVLAGKGLSIIDDSGGVWGLSQLRKAFIKKSGEEYNEYKEWLGVNSLNLDFFDIDECNKNLRSNIRRFDRMYRYIE